MPFLPSFLISHLMCCVKVYYLSWTFLSLKLKKRERREGEGGVGEKKRSHQLRFARSIKLFRFGDVFRGSPFPAAKSC